MTSENIEIIARNAANGVYERLLQDLPKLMAGEPYNLVVGVLHLGRDNVRVHVGKIVETHGPGMVMDNITANLPENRKP